MIKCLWIVWAALPVVVLGFVLGWKAIGVGVLCAIAFVLWSRVLAWLSERAKP